MANIKGVHGKLCQATIWRMAAVLRDSTVVVAVVRTRPRAIPLAMTTMRKSIHGFPSVFCIGMGLRLAFRAAGAPLIQFQLFIFHKTACLQKNVHGRVLSIRAFSADGHYEPGWKKAVR